MKLRPEQKQRLEFILDTIEEKLEEMQTEEYLLNTEDYDMKKDFFDLLLMINKARKELKKWVTDFIFYLDFYLYPVYYY